MSYPGLLYWRTILTLNVTSQLNMSPVSRMWSSRDNYHKFVVNLHLLANLYITFLSFVLIWNPNKVDIQKVWYTLGYILGFFFCPHRMHVFMTYMRSADAHCSVAIEVCTKLSVEDLLCVLHVLLDEKCVCVMCVSESITDIKESCNCMKKTAVFALFHCSFRYFVCLSHQLLFYERGIVERLIKHTTHTHIQCP